MNAGICGDADGSGVAAQSDEIGARVAALMDEKRTLYEQMVLGDISSDVYISEKEKTDEEISRLNRVKAEIKSSKETLYAARSANTELNKKADSTTGEPALTRALVEMLVSCVRVYPGGKVDVEWKVAGF